MEFDGILWTPITLTTMLTARLCMGGNGLGPEMGNFRTWSRRERQRPVAAVIGIAKHCVIDPFLIHSSAPTSGISIFPHMSAYISIYILPYPYLHICLHMKREFQKDVSPQMQVWLAAPSSERMHFGQLLLFFLEDQHNPQLLFASED